MTLLATEPRVQFFAIPWPPSAKGRPRFVRRTGVAYTPAETRNSEAAIRHLLVAEKAVLYDRDVPLAVDLRFYVPRPKSAPKRVLLPTTRPDLDQYTKLLLDASQGILWTDDAQIVTITARKLFCDDQHPSPCQELVVWAAATT